MVNGIEAKPNEFPWKVMVRRIKIIKKTAEGIVTSSRSCGGSIISPKHVLTAAHCTNDKPFTNPQPAKDFQIVIGEHDIGDEKEVIHEVTNVLNHNKWSWGKTLEYDISIITLKDRLTYSMKVAPICLPATTTDHDQYGGRVATAIGWGDLVYNGGTPDKLMKASMTVWGESTTQFPTYDNCKSNTVQLCAFARDGSSVCNGDSGSPLFLEENGRNTVIGVVTGSNDCDGNPSQFARVTKFKEWIKDNTEGTEDSGC